jgi:hypothetical protein
MELLVIATLLFVVGTLAYIGTHTDSSIIK